jgi:Dolichyl-phosphate-mannose-protein mannosyltransferase
VSWFNLTSTNESIPLICEPHGVATIGGMFPGNQVISEPATLQDKSAPRRRDFESILNQHSDWPAALVVALGFCWRVWLAHATFFNVDEAWHYSVANQDSFLHAYRASLTLYHPPLLVLVLYFWKTLGTSNLVLRLPCVIAGSMFCWLYYKWLNRILGRTVAWVGLLLVTFLPTMIAIAADLRQYAFLLMFSAGAALFLERAWATNSATTMLLSAGCLLFAMLSHYSAFLFAASLGVYAIFRMFPQRVSPGVIAAWGAGQAMGLALAGFFYVTHIARFRLASTGTQPTHYYADWYLSQFYFHARHDRLLPFLFRGTFGIFRFIFSWVIIGHLATLLFVAGIVLLLRHKSQAMSKPPAYLVGLLLLLPFGLNWIAVAAGLYPYGRTRQCIFLAIFAVAGVSVALARIAKEKIGPTVALAVGILVLCHLFGTPPGRDMLPLAEQRHEHMDQALTFIRREVSPGDVIYLNKSTEFQLAHYLCDQKPVAFDRSVAGFESFQCHGFRVISTFPDDDAILLETFPSKWREMAHAYGLNPGSKVWVVQGGWTRAFAESLRSRFPEFPELEPHSFGQYLEIFHMTVGDAASAAPQT